MSKSSLICRFLSLFLREHDSSGDRRFCSFTEDCSKFTCHSQNVHLGQEGNIPYQQVHLIL